MELAIDADTVRISGQLTSSTDADALRRRLAEHTDVTAPLTLDVSQITTLSEAGYQALHHVASVHQAPVTVVCRDAMLLCDLELTDLGDVACLQAHAYLTISQPQQAA